MSNNNIRQDQIFIEKYRPNKLNDIIDQDTVVKRLKIVESNNNISHEKKDPEKLIKSQKTLMEF